MHSGDVISFVISEEQSSQRLDTVLVQYLQQLRDENDSLVPTRSKVARWIAQGAVMLDGAVCSKQSYRVQTGDSIECSIPAPPDFHLKPDPDIALNIVYEDEDLLVLCKEAGLVVHPGAGVPDKTLVNGVLAHLGEKFSVGDIQRPGLVHRLDRDTSGLMVVAKHDRSYQHLVQQFMPPRTIHRSYLALVAKAPKGENQGCIEGAIGRHPVDRKRMAIMDSGKPARTHWRVLKRFHFGALLELTLETGRTHQIRVHLESVHSAILGDPVYGQPYGNISQATRAAISRLGRQALHASKLSFLHPRSNQQVSFEAPLTDDMQALLQVLESAK